MMTRFFFLSLIFLLPFNLFSQEDSAVFNRPQIKGYVSGVGSMLNWNSNDPVWDLALQNRLNLTWKPLSIADFNVQFRNRYLYGETVKNTPGYAAQVETDRGLMQLNHNLYSNRTSILNMQLDRAYLHLVNNAWEVTIGRQRINWGQTYVWNPNDIFNAYSFFEYDYPERPGSDAIRLQYFSGIANSLELAVKADSGKNITAAALLKFNKWNYDFQFIGGLLNSSDYVIGTGWSGNIGGAGFKGEASYFHPMHSFSDTSGLALISLSADYSFSNSWYIMGEVLYRYQGKKNIQENLLEYLNAPASVKNLAITDLNLVGQLNVPIGSLVNTSISVMLLPGVKGAFAGPSISVSASDNLEASLSAQVFRGRFPDPITGLQTIQSLDIFFLRLKWSF